MAEYDYYPYETGVTVVHVDSGNTVASFSTGSVTDAYAFEYTTMNLVPGEDYELIVTDSYGDGMDGWVSVDIYDDDEWEMELAYVDGLDFYSSTSVTFSVPTATRRSKIPPHHTKTVRNKTFCRNTKNSFTLEGGVEENCHFLEAHWPKTMSLCDNRDVALACPATCGHCDAVKGIM